MASRSFLSQATSSSSAASAASTSTSATPRRLPRPLSSSSDLLTDDDTALVEHDQLQDEHLMLRERSAEDHYHTNVSTASSFSSFDGRMVHSSPRPSIARLVFSESTANPSNPSPLITPTRSTTDLPNQVGNTSRVDHEPYSFRELYDNGLPPLNERRDQWEGNYKEAAIFLEEGKNNDKFSHHPRSREELPPYLIVHNAWFYILDLGASLLLLMLGFFEKPCLSMLEVPIQVHGTIELVTLTLIGVQMGLKTRWIGWKTFFKHKRTFLKMTTLILMFVEAIVVLIRGDSHFRVSRALRPIFLVDNYYCEGVRRFIRQILQSLPPIIDMLVLVFFIMLIYSVFGFYLFSKVDGRNFETLVTSFISLFVLLTTANFPDVMMESYNQNQWSAIFFISYLTINLYFIMNLLLAVVYDAFSRIEKEKFRRLFLHKRKASQHAFRLLVTKERPDEVSFQHFEGLLSEFKPRATPTETYLIFKLLNKSCTGYLSVEEFCDVYDACLYSWSIDKPEEEWFHSFGHPWYSVFKQINQLVVHDFFKYTCYCIVFVNGVIIIVQTYLIPSADSSHVIYAPWLPHCFIGFYTLEACLKLLGLGFTNYFRSYWNIFDLTVTVLGILSLIFEFVGIPLTFIIILRTLWLLTLFRMKKRFRDVFGTAVILIPRFTSAVIVLLLIYYFFSIIGMELFHGVELKNCCKNTTVEEYYKFEEDSNSNAYFYLNNFDSLPISGVTLFELTVVNNWYVIMEGFAHVTNDWSRLFFMIFYVFTLIVMTIIVAFILDTFRFRIQYKKFLKKEDEIKKLSAEIHLTSSEVLMLLQRSNIEEALPNQNLNTLFRFVGVKTRTKEQLERLMYHEEMEVWMEEAREEDAKVKASIERGILEDTIHPDFGQDQSQDSVSTELEGNISHPTSTRGFEVVQVVVDEDEVTTIRRPVLPDLK